MSKVTRRAALVSASAAAAGAASGCALLERARGRKAAAPAPEFLHGVASGDPRSDALVIWTRATPTDEERAPVELSWRVARDRELTKVVAKGLVDASAGRDHTAKVDVQGLEPGTHYYYGFAAGGAQSPVGHARTLPDGHLDSVTLAVCSCSNYPFGYFHAYRDMARRAPDVILHLGDYIYEYGPDGYGGDVGARLGRVHAPPHETVTLADYRARHAQYRADRDLQAAAAAAPWIASWDDHEFTNNPWREGAQNHQAAEGDWQDRKAAALRAYFEWMPVRDPAPGQSRETFWRAFEFGDLATLVMLETRLTGRDKQLVYARDLEDPDDPEARAAFLDKLSAPERTMIDARQERFLIDACRSSRAANKPWQVIGNQVLFTRQSTPNLDAAWDEATKARLSAASNWVPGAIARGRHRLPGNLDAWDGYPVQRDRIADALGALGVNLVMVAGDTHTSWVNTVHDTSGAVLGAEFGATGVTSPGWMHNYGPAEPSFAELTVRENPDIDWVDTSANGYVLVTLTQDDATAEFVAVSDVTSPVGDARTLATWRVQRAVASGALTKPMRVIAG